MLEIQ